MIQTILEIFNLKLFGIDLIDFKNLIEMLLRLLLNLGVLLLIIRWLYYGTARRKDFLFTFILIGTVIFLLCYLLGSVKLQLGFALGLFAVFGIIRYRTDAIPIKEMTYLFVVISISVINALSNKKVSYAELFVTNFILVGLIYGLERLWLLKHESVKTIVYEKIDLIKPEARLKLIEDLEERTGIKPINKIEIGKIDFLKDIAQIKIYYFETGSSINMADQELNSSNDDDD